MRRKRPDEPLHSLESESESTDNFFVFSQCTYLCALPRLPLFYIPSCTLFAACRPPSFIKRNQHLCLTLRTFGTQSARCRQRGSGVHCPSLLTLARLGAERSTRSARRASMKYLLEHNIIVPWFSQTVRWTTKGGRDYII